MINNKFYIAKSYDELIRVEQAIDIKIITLLKKIESKMKIIDTLPILKNDLYHKLNFKSIREDSIPKIIHNYLSVPEEFRSIKDKDITEKTIFQLDLLLEEINKIEKSLIKEQICFKVKAML